MLSMMKMLLKGEVGGHALNSHGNYIVDHGKSWNYVFEFLWEPYVFNSLPTSGDFCHLLITFANRLDPDQAQPNVGPDLDPNCLTP